MGNTFLLNNKIIIIFINLQDFELVKLLKAARNCVNILNENLTLFVRVILVRILKVMFLINAFNDICSIASKMDEQK